MNFPLAGTLSMKILSLLLLLTLGDAGKEEPKENGVVKYDPPPIVSVRKLAISELRLVRRLKKIWRELNESSTAMDVQKLLNA